MRLTLLSNSATHGKPYLSHATDAIRKLASSEPVAFVPFALADINAYSRRVSDALGQMGVEVVQVPKTRDEALTVLDQCGTVFIGGGNTFRLLSLLHAVDLLWEIRTRVLSGSIRYLGSSAGTNVACPTIRTTNDMPIVQPASLEALSLIPFQINPHYTDPDPGSTHMGETREQRITEFLEENDCPVVGLREGSWIELEGEQMFVQGTNGARSFRRGAAPEELSPGSDISALLTVEPRFDLPVSP